MASLDPKISLALAIGASLLGAGGVYWQHSALQEKKQILAKVRREADSAAAKKKELEASAQKVQESEKQLAHLEKGVPEFAYVSTLLSELEAVGLQCGFSVLGVKPQAAKVAPKKDTKKSKAKDRKPYEELNLELKARGTFASAQKFLTQLQDFPKIAAVRTLTISPKVDPNRTGSPLLDLTIELRVFLFPELAHSKSTEGTKRL
ncbi:MAG TPA: type 4a pilus biogenesis protein PilO [Fimbriimonadaceae bacterium]|nr:type 4a pilus biogenesis protein PilO [Fimbriimonadaceae bacterium]